VFTYSPPVDESIKHLPAIPVRASTAILLVHGLGSRPAWWKPLLPALHRIGLRPRALTLPSLEDHGPESWCRVVLRHLGRSPTVLIGHSLGAAVCAAVARQHRVEALVLLACPPFLPDHTPPPPPGTGLSAAAIARVERFLRSACAQAPPGARRCVHFIGANDRWVPEDQARRLPFPIVVIPGAGHGLNRSPALAAELIRFLLASGFAGPHPSPVHPRAG
jgi:pimeloyl-ACP methyl ester carboxylesterase